MAEISTGRIVLRILYWIPALSLAITIFVLSSIPDFGVLERSFLTQHDKITHLIVYGLLAWWVLWGWGKGMRGRPGIRRLIVAVAAVAVYGISDEFHQTFIPGRLACVEDWLADMVGGALGSAAFAVVSRGMRTTEPPGGFKLPGTSADATGDVE